MDSMFFFLGLLVLALPIAAIAGLVIAIKARNQNRLIERRLIALEANVAALAKAPPPSRTADAYKPPGAIVSEQPSEPVVEPTSETAPPPSEPESAAPTPPAIEEAAPPEPAAPEQVVPPSVPPPPRPPRAPPREVGFEERFGTRWVVWIGGLALALGGIFLVRYSIEQGWIGPGVRIALGGLLALVLIAGGEWTRRQDRQIQIADLPSAHIPSILTAAGTVVAYATVYAAYALYGFLSPPSAFLLLGIVALATLAAALLHGPALAGLGLIGAYVTPLLVASAKPDYWALYLYLAVVTAAALALARLRLWLWLALTAIVFSFFWVLPGLGVVPIDALLPHLFHVVVGFALAAALIVAGLLYGPSAASGRIDPVSSSAIGAYLLGALLIVLASRHDTVALAAFVVLVAATIAIAWRSEAATGAVPAAAVMVALAFAEWSVTFDFGQLVAPAGPVAGAIPSPQPAQYGLHLVLGAFFAILFGAAGYLAQGRSGAPLIAMLWSACAVFMPLTILIALYYRIAGFERSIPFAGLALLLAALYGFATERLDRREPRPGLAAATAIFATGAVASLALALTFALDKGWLTIALSLMVPGIAWIYQQRNLAALRWLAAALVVVVIARIVWEPRIVGDAVGTTPIFNWLLYGYGVPAASFWYAGYLLRRRADDTPSRLIDAAAILFTVLLAHLEIRHYATGGNVYQPMSSLLEVALQASVGIALTMALERLRLTTGNIIHNLGALVVGGLTLLTIVFRLCLVENPFFTADRVGGLVFNLIMLGYLLPAILMTALALMTRGHRPRGYSIVAAITAVVLALLYLTLEVTRIFQGPSLTSVPTTDAEQYTYSAVWLAFGVVLLIVGIALRAQSVRFASAAVVSLTIVKVFLIDLSDLTGIYRALSFIGLGLVLVGIGWIYQRLLFPAQRGQVGASSQTDLRT
jgi:uncharacterized membrane protein